MAYLDINGEKLYYETAGAGNETLVLVHAGFVDSGMWDSQWHTFAQHYRVIRFDMRLWQIRHRHSAGCAPR